MSDTLSRISVIVSTYSVDRMNYLLDAIDSVQEQSLKPHETILVLDPCPKLVELCKTQVPANVKIVVNQTYGLSSARNAGVKAATGDIVAFIDDDAIADRNWLANLIQNYEDPKVVGVGGLVKPLWEDGYPSWFPEELNWVVGCSYKGLPESRSLVRNPIGCNMSFRKNIFSVVGYFRLDIGRFGKRLLAGEEPELSLRILSKIPKSKIVYDPKAVVMHRVSRNRTKMGYIWVRSFYEGISKALILKSKSGSSETLTSEDSYLKYLLRVAIPARIRKAYRPDRNYQTLILLVSMTAVFMGFLAGKLRGDINA